MHISYEEQLRYKKDFVKFHFDKNLKEDILIEDTIKSPNEFEYRNKITVPVRLYKGKNKMGLYLRNTNIFFRLDIILFINQNWMKLLMMHYY